VVDFRRAELTEVTEPDWISGQAFPENGSCHAAIYASFAQLICRAILLV
jgi:hypothetical protein